MNNIDRYKQDFSNLVELGDSMYADLTVQVLQKRGTPIAVDLQQKHKEIAGMFENEYQKWYTEACAIMRQLLPERLNEFEALY